MFPTDVYVGGMRRASHLARCENILLGLAAVSGRRVRWSVVALRSTIIPLVTFVGCVGALVLVVGFTL